MREGYQDKYELAERCELLHAINDQTMTLVVLSQVQGNCAQQYTMNRDSDRLITILAPRHIVPRVSEN